MANPIVNYLQGAKSELKKVQWPTRQEVINYTITVIAISLAVAVFIGVVDFGLNWLLERAIA